MVAGAAALIAVGRIGLVIYARCPNFPDPMVSTDGKAYLDMTHGKQREISYNMRFLVPWLMRPFRRWWLAMIVAWQGLTYASLVAAAVCIGLLALAGGLTVVQAVLAAALFVGLPLFATDVMLPILVDAPALALTAGAALALAHGSFWNALVLSVVGAGYQKTDADDFNILNGGIFRFGRRLHREQVLVPAMMVLPWGACLLAALAPSPVLWLSLAGAYAMVFIAGDCTREFQWAFLPMCLAAASVVPDQYALAAGLIHFCNPFRGAI